MSLSARNSKQDEEVNMMLLMLTRAVLAQAESLDATAAVEGLPPRPAHSRVFDAPSLTEDQRRIQAIEGRSGMLQDRIFHSKATLALLKSLLVRTGNARTKILYRRALTPAYDLQGMTISVDGRPVYTWHEGLQPEDPSGVIGDLWLPEGNHTLDVRMSVAGHGLGVFGYVDSYAFEVRSSHTFYAQTGETLELQIRPAERRPLLERYQDRLQIRVAQHISER